MGLVRTLAVVALSACPALSYAQGREPIEPIAPTSWADCNALSVAWNDTLATSGREVSACLARKGGTTDVSSVRSPCGLPGNHAVGRICVPIAERDQTLRCRAETANESCRAKLELYLDYKRAQEQREARERQAAEERRQQATREAQRARLEEARAAEGRRQRPSAAASSGNSNASVMKQCEMSTTYLTAGGNERPCQARAGGYAGVKDAQATGMAKVLAYEAAANTRAEQIQQASSAIFGALGEYLTEKQQAQREQRELEREIRREQAEEARVASTLAAQAQAEAQAREQERLAREQAARDLERARIASIKFADPWGDGGAGEGKSPRAPEQTSALIDPWAQSDSGRNERSGSSGPTLVDPFAPRVAVDADASANEIVGAVADLSRDLYLHSAQNAIEELDRLAKQADGRALSLGVGSAQSNAYASAAKTARQASERFLAIKRLVFWAPYATAAGAAATGTSEERQHATRSLAEQAWSEVSGAALGAIVGTAAAAGLSTALSSTPTAPQWRDDNPFHVVLNKSGQYSLKERQLAYRDLFDSYRNRGAQWPQSQQKLMHDATLAILQASKSNH